MSQPNNKPIGGFAKWVDGFTRWSLKWVPDSLVFVLALTGVVYVLSLVLTNHGPIQLIDDYAKGFWVLLTFAMQMCILLITGFVVADSSYVKRGIIAFISWPKNRKSLLLVFILSSSALWWLHWGIGMMASMIMGREIAVRRPELKIHYPLLGAISYGLICMANGPSQAAPLLLATPGHFMEKVTGIIPLTETSFAPSLLVTQLILFIAIPALMLLMMPKAENSTLISPEFAEELRKGEEEENNEGEVSRPAERWERSPLLQCAIALCGLFWFAKFIYVNGVGKINLDTLNFGIFFLALLLHKSPQRFLASVKRGMPTVSGVIIQFPLYAGIFGIISNSGLAEILAHWFVSFSTAQTYPWIVFLYTGFIDFFVPSAGSKFVIEAPYLLPAAQTLGVSVPQVINYYTYGSVWCNLIQPFWALPILAFFRVRFQDLLPYTLALYILQFVVVSFMALTFPNGF